MQDEILQRARILIVDDYPNDVFTLRLRLEDAGYQHLASTTDPREGLALVTEFGPDLVLLDLIMVPFDGLWVLKQPEPRLRAEDSLPVLVLTGDLNPETKQLALAAGARDLLTKPFDPIELLLRVRNLLDALAVAAVCAHAAASINGRSWRQTAPPHR